ncbi:MAG: DUF2662 domain-containing protein [Acidobacteria bacterium]|nr:DUF2662 domain-containing protein [Acidobacteriota bacterium]
MWQGFFDRVELRLRRLFERAGGAVDSTFHRKHNLDFDISTLLPRLEREVERSLRQEDGHLVAPHRVELRYNYETWTELSPRGRENLEAELTASLFEYISNRRYRTNGKFEVKIGYDAFTSGVETRLSFELPPKANAHSTLQVMLVEQATGVRHYLHLTSGAEPAGIGRNIANALTLNDPTVSNFHAAIVLRDNGRLELADRGGANGTAINGVALPSAGRGFLADGDLVRIGRIECRLQVETSN